MQGAAPAACRSKERRLKHKRRIPAASMEVCRYWMEDQCTRSSCPYTHPPKKKQQQQQQQQQQKKKNNKAYSPTACDAGVRSVRSHMQHRPVAAAQSKCLPKLDSAPIKAHNVVLNHCKPEVEPAFITDLIGHDAAVTGIVLPCSSQMLFSVGEDATLRAWDYNTGLCSDILHLAHPPSCLFNSFSDPNWLFIGLPEEVRVCNLSARTQQTLAASSPVLSLSSLANLLVAGLRDGAILVWRFEPSSAFFHPSRCLFGKEKCPVLSLEPSLATGSSIIYAGSLDGMVRIWDLASGACLQAMYAHTKAITQLLSYDHTSLLSVSQDGAIKLWKVSARDNQICLQDAYLPQADAEEDGGVSPQLLAICGVFDEANTPILFTAYSDNKVHIMEVPSLKWKGRIRTKSPIQAMDTGPRNMLFLGSSKGDISVWKWK